MSGLFPGIAGVADTVVNRLLPDKSQIAQNETDLAKAQITTNQLEITNKKDWRDAIGIICAFGLFSQTIINIVRVFVPHLPPLDITTILSIVMPMLGLSFHSWVTGK